MTEGGWHFVAHRNWIVYSSVSPLSQCRIVTWSQPHNNSNHFMYKQIKKNVFRWPPALHHFMVCIGCWPQFDHKSVHVLWVHMLLYMLNKLTIPAINDDLRTNKKKTKALDKPEQHHLTTESFRQFCLFSRDLWPATNTFTTWRHDILVIYMTTKCWTLKCHTQIMVMIEKFVHNLNKICWKWLHP